MISLAQAYAKNNGCIGMFEAQMKKLRENKQSKMELYKDGK